MQVSIADHSGLSESGLLATIRHGLQADVVYMLAIRKGGLNYS
jgi:hypothetical protein